MTRINGTHPPRRKGAQARPIEAPTHVALLARDGEILQVNRPWRDTPRQGWLSLPDPSVGANYLALCDAVRGPHSADAEALAEAIRDAAAGRCRSRRLEYRCAGADPEQWFELRVVALEPGVAGSFGAAVLVEHEEKTQVRRTERRLEESLAQVRSLAAHLQDVREEERRLIAREIHDELGHQLTALKIDVVALERELARVSSSLASRASSMKILFDQMIASVRRLSAELRPGLLDDFGLVAAVEWQANVFAEHTGIAVELALDSGDDGVSTPLATALFRILQESLTNVARHADASRVRIALRRDHRELCLEVRDDGRGFDPAQRRDPTSNGITGMRERALALGGTFAVDACAGAGTTVRVAIPLEDEPADAPDVLPDHSSLPAAS